MAKVKNMFKLFMNNSAEVNDWNRNDEKLLKAVEAYDIAKVTSLLNKKEISTTKCGPKGYGSLHYVCVKGYEDLLELFLMQGANVNEVNERGNSPLHLASHNGFPKIVCRLLMAGAKVNFCNPYQMTALHIACNSKSENIVKILMENKANVNARDKTQKTPLFFSCYHGELSICKYLVENGAWIDVEDISKVTPLLTAVRQNHVDITKYLLEKGANPYIIDRFEMSPVKAGKESNSREMKKVFAKVPLTPSQATANTSNEMSVLQRQTSADLSVQVLENLSFGDTLKTEMVEMRKPSPNRKDLVTERRPLSAPPPPPLLMKRTAAKSMSENLEDLKPSDNTRRQSLDLTDSLHSVSKNLKTEESNDCLSLFPSDNAEGNKASFLGLSPEEHRSRLSSLSNSDFQNKWDREQKEEDVISNTSQVSDETRLNNNNQEFFFIPGNATPKMGGNMSHRRQILNLRQENNQLRETIHENQNKIKDQEEMIKHLENVLLEEERKNKENSEIHTNEEISIENGITENTVEAEESPKLLKREMENMVHSRMDELDLAETDNKVTQGHEEIEMFSDSKLIINMEKNTETLSDDARNSGGVIEEIRDEKQMGELQEEHISLQDKYKCLIIAMDQLQEDYSQLQEEKEMLLISQQHLKQENEKATKQNCNLLNMKDNLQQEVEDMAVQQKHLQEEYDLLSEKTDLLEKTMEKMGKSEEAQSLALGHLDEAENLLQAVESKEPWEGNRREEELKVLQLDNTLLEEQCRKLLVEKDILEEENAELKEAKEEAIKILESENKNLQSEKFKLSKRVEELTKDAHSLQHEYGLLQQEMQLLKPGEEGGSHRAREFPNEAEPMTNSEEHLETNSKIATLQNEITKLQQRMVETEKKYDEIVQNYRIHLISAIQGYLDPDVEKALYSIIELRRLEFYC